MTKHGRALNRFFFPERVLLLHRSRTERAEHNANYTRPLSLSIPYSDTASVGGTHTGRVGVITTGKSGPAPGLKTNLGVKRQFFVENFKFSSKTTTFQIWLL